MSLPQLLAYKGKKTGVAPSKIFVPAAVVPRLLNLISDAIAIRFRKFKHIRVAGAKPVLIGYKN